LNIGGGKSNANQPKRLLGLDLTGAQYGTCIPVVFGQNKVPGNVIWYGDFKAIPHKEKQGGKGGGGKSNTTYTYTSSFQIALCEGVASVIKTFDGTTTNSLAGAGGLGFTGTLGQAAWAHLSGPEFGQLGILAESVIRGRGAQPVRRRHSGCEPSRHHHGHL
jgi:hypothetical protein